MPRVVQSLLNSSHTIESHLSVIFLNSPIWRGTSTSSSSFPWTNPQLLLTLYYFIFCWCSLSQISVFFRFLCLLSLCFSILSSYLCFCPAFSVIFSVKDRVFWGVSAHFPIAFLFMKDLCKLIFLPKFCWKIRTAELGWWFQISCHSTLKTRNSDYIFNGLRRYLGLFSAIYFGDP